MENFGKKTWNRSQLLNLSYIFQFFVYLDLIFVPGRYFPLKLTYIKTKRFISISIRYENVFEVDQAGFEKSLPQIESIKKKIKGEKNKIIKRKKGI